MKQRRAGTAWDLLTPAERERRLVAHRARNVRVYREMRAAQGFVIGQRKPNLKQRNDKKEKIYNFVVACKIKTGHCYDCTLVCEDWNHCIFAFDHLVQETKSFALSEAAKQKGITEQTVLNEIAKCHMVCANCHTLRTWVYRDHDYKGHKIDVPVIPSLLDCPEWDVA